MLPPRGASPVAIKVALTWPEILLAANAGVMRRLNGVREQRCEPFGERPPASWNDDINGAIAELVVAKWLDVFWSGTVGRIDLPDVGRLQVRSKRCADERLVVTERDAPEEIFVSVRLDALPICSIDGWMRGADAMQEAWFIAKAGAPKRYFVPNERLRDPRELNNTG